MDKRVLLPLTRSQRQYGHVNNAPAQRLARTVTDVKPGPMLDFLEPALASLVARAPAGERWVHEIKFDGYRFQAHVTPRGVRFLTRRGRDWSAKARAS